MRMNRDYQDISRLQVTMTLALLVQVRHRMRNLFSEVEDHVLFHHETLLTY
jgi:hypothetical protein